MYTHTWLCLVYFLCQDCTFRIDGIPVPKENGELKVIRKRRIKLRRWEDFEFRFDSRDWRSKDWRKEGNGISLMSGQHNERTKQEGHCKRRGLHFWKWQVGNRKLVSDEHLNQPIAFELRGIGLF